MDNDRLKLQDPREQYPKPPFPRQPQPVPGLAQQMEPQPDHGEQSYKGCGKLVGRKALITGGDSGIGRAVAISFAREGADVAISYLPSEESDAKAVSELIEQAGRKAVALLGDITNEQFCQQLVGNAVSALNGLDILVNNARVQKSYPSISDIPTEHFDKAMKTNLYAMFWITRAAVPHLKPDAAIINTTSIQGYEPSATLLDYAMTKAAIADFTKALSKQMIEQGVRVNAIAPRPFWTPLQPTGGQTQDKIEKFGRKCQWDDQDSLWRLRRCMCCWLHKKGATSPEKCMG